MLLRFNIIFSLLLFSYGYSQKKPSYVDFKLNKDTTTVSINNYLACPAHVKILNTTTKKIQTIDLKAYEKKNIFSLSEKDTIAILNNYKFKLRYGNSSPLKKYDTLYNYALPFLKGKRYKIIQGHNTNFTHKGAFSKYAIDFRMNVGQTICAMKDGVVVSVKEDSNKGGRGKKYYKDANYIVIYHNDGLFTQYVHLKKDGAIIKRGDSVKKHQPIGYSGNTGMSTEPHLHFGVYKTTSKGFASLPYILDSIPSKKYIKGKHAYNK